MNDFDDIDHDVDVVSTQTANPNHTFPIDLAVIAETFHLLVPPGQVTEVRVLDAVDVQRRGPYGLSGFFDDPDCLLAAIATLARASGVYLIPNPVVPGLFARCPNRLDFARKGRSTIDRDIVSRRWLLVDLDPTRPSGTSASKAEHEAAWERMVVIEAVLAAEQHWPNAVLAESGNGYHLLYRIELPVDDEGLIKRVLQGLDRCFSTAAVAVDTSTCNAAQLCKLYGTMACKGTATEERPHRMARLLTVPTSLEVVTFEQLQTVAAWSMVAPQPASMGDWSHAGTAVSEDWLDDWIAEHELAVEGPFAWNGGRKFVLSVCPWNPEHTNRSAYLLQFADGGVHANCLHTSCRHHTWPDLRDVIEPGWRERSDSMVADAERGERSCDPSQEPWEPPAEFNAFILPRFPDECLPRCLREFVLAEAEAIQMPVALPGMLVLAAGAVAQAPYATVSVRPGWTEQLNLYALVVQPPATRKIAVFRDVFSVVEAVERERQQAMRSAITAAETAHRLMEERVKRAEKEVVSAGAEERLAKKAEAEQLAQELDSMSIPTLPRIMVDDTTPEKLHSLLSRHNGCMALLSAEGDVIDMMGGRYSSNGRANLNVYLKAQVGDTLIIDRINRPSERVDHPTLTIA